MIPGCGYERLSFVVFGFCGTHLDDHEHGGPWLGQNRLHGYSRRDLFGSNAGASGLALYVYIYV